MQPPTSHITEHQRSVLLLDDHRVFTDLLRLTLDMQPDLRCVAVAHTVATGVALAATVDVDVAIVDLQLPDASGLDAIGPLLAAHPRARIVVLTAHPRAALAERAFALGAVAFLAKDGALGDILTAVRDATAERLMVCADLRREQAAAALLTPREHDVLRELAGGRDAPRIAAALGISLHTTRDHIKAILAKLDVHSQLDAVVTAGRLGLVEIGSRI
ncbi:response regulator [Pseudonocardia sp. GCM10023141]|uniref:response regulator n=1 Tax=Pseudonocardia sp. GCM10023141 TaxID=3252653 RepID=UPI0036242D1A